MQQQYHQGPLIRGSRSGSNPATTTDSGVSAERNQSQHFLFDNVLGPGGARKKRPTQIPIHALQFNECVNNNPWHQRKEQQFQTRQQDVANASQSTQTFAEVTSTTSIQQQQYNCPHPQQQYNNCPHPQQQYNNCPHPQQQYNNCPHPQQQYNCPHPQQQFIPVNQSTASQLRFIEAARQGFGQFQRDFEEPQQQSRPFLYMPPPMPLYQLEPAVEVHSDFPPETNVRLDVDDSAFADNREVKNYIQPGQREFNLFDDYNKAGTDQIKHVYNVNTIDYCNAKEICGKRLYQHSISRWPVEIIGCDLGEVRKQACNIPSRRFSAHSTLMSVLDTGSEFESSLSSSRDSSEIGDGNSSGAFGMMSLARCLNGEWGDENKFGYVTFVGMNLHKLFKDLDRPGPVCPTFGGPLADRNYQLDCSGMNVVRGIPEYELDGGCDMNWLESYRWKRSTRIKRRILEHFNFDTLAFIFYTFYGDALQLLAAEQLYNRGWRFHKLFQVWITPLSSSMNNGYGIHSHRQWLPGVYQYFDYNKWAVYQVELKQVNEGVLEGRPWEFRDALWE